MRKGVTLAEVLVTVVILAILAAFVVPNYLKVVERGRQAEAVTILGEMRSISLAYELERGVYTASKANLGWEDPKSKYFTFNFLIPGSMAPYNIAEAIRNNKEIGPFLPQYRDYKIYIDIDGNIDTSEGP